ncbi:MAG TPA: SUF system Fe-S cluster assembly protein [Alphaproteobacteria bacterium]|nr:SUF system Fe-S cluster assembly protein [Alphaproteobacteria bacterium]
MSEPLEKALEFLGEGAPAPAGPTPEDALRDKAIEAIQTVYDPEIPVNIYELGLIYRVEVTPEHNINIDMTLTAPGCPEAQNLPVSVEQAVGAVEGVGEVKVEIVWDPPWTPDMMSEAARLELGMF